MFSSHEKNLGHYRRYDKKSLKGIIDLDKFEIVDLWYQDILGVLGSLYYFKLKKTDLKSESGHGLVRNQGKIYDKILIPIQGLFEKIIRFPFGLNLTAILKRIDD